MASSESWKVHVRSNDGSERYVSASDEVQASKIAKRHRQVGNYMVCIENGDAIRTHRWDRNKVEGENRWRRVDPDEFETLGPLRTIRRA